MKSDSSGILPLKAEPNLKITEKTQKYLTAPGGGAAHGT